MFNVQSNCPILFNIQNRIQAVRDTRTIRIVFRFSIFDPMNLSVKYLLRYPKAIYGTVSRQISPPREDTILTETLPRYT